MAAVDAKAFAEGQVSDSLSTIFTATAPVILSPCSISFVNTSSTTQTLELYVNKGTSRLSHRWENMKQYHRRANDFVIVLETGDTLEAVTTTASVVNYEVNGGEEVA